ncbi:MAG TPA: plastocyanin/azurin family copper-binding protein [Chloroflexota bacterium]|jgi:uncharacterized cupredoxin-like copper-binding protein
MKRLQTLAGIGLVGLFLVTGCSSALSPSGAPTDVKVTANEFRYDASQTTFVAGRTYHFIASNLGTTTHDWVIAPRGGAEDDALVMVEDDDFQPGDTFTKDFTFPKAGNYEIACHVAGHYEAGMVLPIIVS